MHGMEAVAIFIVIVFAWRSIYVRHGNIHFWQLAANRPDDVIEWMKSRDDWVILHPNDPEVEQFKNNADFVGPFKLAVPSFGDIVTIFAKNTTIEKSQNEFIESFCGSREQARIPWLSSLTMLYPIVAMMAIANQGAPILPTLGYGFANLGYLLFGAGILVGSFRALGFRYRISTLIAAVAVWIMGTVLSNI